MKPPLSEPVGHQFLIKEKPPDPTTVDKDLQGKFTNLEVDDPIFSDKSVPGSSCLKPPIVTPGSPPPGQDRYDKVIKFWRKKYKKSVNPAKLIHKKKSRVANKKLRVHGKFVTVE